MNYYQKIIILFILFILSVLNCPLIFQFITVRGGYIIFHYWFIFFLMFYYNYIFLDIEIYSNEKNTKITKDFYDAIHEKTNVKIRFMIYVLYVSLFLSLIVIMIFSNDQYMTLFQQIVYSIDFIIGTILSTIITKHDYFYMFSNYENVNIIHEEDNKNNKNNNISSKNEEIKLEIKVI